VSITVGPAVGRVPYGASSQCYEISIRTWTTDRDIAFDLAIQISESLSDNDAVDATATTIGIEERPINERERVYIDIVGPPSELRAVHPGSEVKAMGT
jgi:hypothetical protein